MTDFSLRILGGGAAATGETDETHPRSVLGRPIAGRRSDSAHAALLAQILDNLAFANPEGGPAASPLQSALRETGDLRRAIAALSGPQRSRLNGHLPSAALEELISLSAESDTELFAEALYQWAGRQEREERVDVAGMVYGMFAQRRSDGGALVSGAPEGLRASAARRLDAILGRGAVGPRAEFLLRRFAREASNPVMIAGMAAGSFVFSTARTAILSRMLAAPGRGVLGARALAATGAYLMEVPAFWATTKGLNEALAPGQQAWDLRTNLRELAGLGLTLGALKLTGAGASALSGRLASSSNPMAWSATERFGHGVLQQGSMLGGIMLGHRLEVAAGLRPELPGATNLVDSLSMLLQFHVGGK
ncbi:MAG: hypothetical protein K8R69_11670, partial [Deltaproteobacteria bacterium]|nr:hypothetical protein [Deltaproteobacteria bacterium]